MRSMLFMVVTTIGPLCGCIDNGATLQSARQPLVESLHLQRMVVLSRPPIIAATRPEDLPVARRIAENTDPAVLAARESARWVGIDALPFLTSTETGKRFLAAAAPRALARGMPPESCPAAAMAGGTPGTTRAQAAGQALERCLARLAPERPGCGCRIVALDNLVTVPREDTAYATGTSARMRSAALGIDLLLVAEEVAGGAMLLRDLHGPVARLVSGEGDAVTLSFNATGRRFEGYRIAVGFRRGRIAERIYVVDADGNRLSLLIGFEPDELADRAGAWLAWPPEG